MGMRAAGRCARIHERRRAATSPGCRRAAPVPARTWRKCADGRSWLARHAIARHHAAQPPDAMRPRSGTKARRAPLTGRAVRVARAGAPSAPVADLEGYVAAYDYFWIPLKSVTETRFAWSCCRRVDRLHTFKEPSGTGSSLTGLILELSGPDAPRSALILWQ